MKFLSADQNQQILAISYGSIDYFKALFFKKNLL